MREETQDRNSAPQTPGTKSFELPTGEHQSESGAARLGKSIKVKGEISGAGDLYIDGEVEGKIELQGNRVTVGPDGRVQADVMARDLAVVGRLQGKVCIEDKTEVRATGTLEGEIATGRISVDYGAVLHATVDVVKPSQETIGAKPNSAAKRQPDIRSSSADEAADREAPAELQLTAS